MLDGTQLFLGEDDEMKMLRENNHVMSTKVMNLEDTINNYAVEIRFIKEELREAESKLKSNRLELDQEIERRRTIERDYQDEIRGIQQQLDDAQAQVELHEQRERTLQDAKQNLEVLNRELEKGNKDKLDLISELSRELNQRKTDCDEYQREVQQLLREKKSLEDVLMDEKKNHERVVLELEDEIIAVNGKNEDKMRRVTKDMERDKAKQGELMTHFKTQLQQLEEQVEAYRRQMIDLQSQNQKLVHHSNQVAQRERFLKGKLESTQEQLQQHSTQHALLHQNYMHLNKEKDQAQSAEKRLKEQIDDLIRKQEQREERHTKEVEKLNKEVRQLQTSLQKIQEKSTFSETRVTQLDQSKNQLQIELEKEQEDRKQDNLRNTRQIERLQQDFDRQDERHQQEIRTLQEANDKLREVMAQKEKSYHEHIDIIKTELNETQTLEDSLANSKAERLINEMTARIKVLEERNEMLERKQRQNEAGGQSVTKNLHVQNELLRETLDTAQREKEELADKVRILTQHQREQDELLSMRKPLEKMKVRLQSPKRVGSPTKRIASPPKRLIEELTRPPTVDVPRTTRSHLEREYNLSPRGTRPANATTAMRVPLIGSPSAGSSSLHLNNINLTPTLHRRQKNPQQQTQRITGFLK
jgi:chromosome segregation ATPase